MTLCWNLMVRLLGSLNENTWPVSSQHPHDTVMYPHGQPEWKVSGL